MAEQIAVRVENVSKDFLLPQEKVSSLKGMFTSLSKGQNRKKQTQHALRNVSFEIKKGEFFGIVGRNGSGKSTLLKILAGIYQPTAGKTYTQGKLVPFIELGVGFNPELTGRENVYLNGAMLGFSKKEVDAMYNSIVEFAELERFMDQKLKNYSSGMQVRLAFSMAIRAKADILLVDEVLAVGDADFQRKCFDYFKQLKGDDTTVIFVTHDMNAIREYCDRALLINDSKIVDIGDPDNIAKQYSRLFIESAKNNPSSRKSDRRWGNEAIKYDYVKLDNNVLVDGQELVIKAKITAKVDTDNSLIGFVVKNAANQGLVGTNNLIEGKMLGKLDAGQSVNITWKVPNIFSDGSYIVDATVSQSNGVECDWWEGVASFTVARETEHAPYIVSPPIKLNLEKSEA